MKEKIDFYAQILNLKWQLNAMIINQGLKIIDIINEHKRWERQCEYDKKRNDLLYQQIMQMRKKYEKK